MNKYEWTRFYPIFIIRVLNIEIRIFQNSHPVQNTLILSRCFIKNFYNRNLENQLYQRVFSQNFHRSTIQKNSILVSYCEYRNRFLFNDSTVKSENQSQQWALRSNWKNMNRLYSTLYLSLQISKSSLCRDIYKRLQLLSQFMYKFFIFSLKIFQKRRPLKSSFQYGYLKSVRNSLLESTVILFVTKLSILFIIE